MKPRFREACIVKQVQKLEVADDIGEDVTNRRAEQRQDDDDDNCDQYQDQSILDEALTFFAREIQHGCLFLLPSKIPTNGILV
jgi:hypothetical protein